MTLARRHGELRGRVQGVGMRPCVAELARALELAGQVRNDAGGVVIEIEGPLARLDRFVERCRKRIHVGRICLSGYPTGNFHKRGSGARHERRARGERFKRR